jgi:hypothetical protein
MSWPIGRLSLLSGGRSGISVIVADNRIKRKIKMSLVRDCASSIAAPVIYFVVYCDLFFTAKIQILLSNNKITEVFRFKLILTLNIVSRAKDRLFRV